ncbi:hypothetical protein RRG08_011795, partial [Elysia crispata]
QDLGTFTSNTKLNKSESGKTRLYRDICYLRHRTQTLKEGAVDLRTDAYPHNHQHSCLFWRGKVNLELFRLKCYQLPRRRYVREPSGANTSPPTHPIPQALLRVRLFV